MTHAAMAHRIGGREADVALVETGEVDDAEAERSDRRNSGDGLAVQCAGCLQVKAALWAVGRRSGGFDVDCDPAQIPVGLSEPVDVGTEVVVVPATDSSIEVSLLERRWGWRLDIKAADN